MLLGILKLVANSLWFSLNGAHDNLTFLKIIYSFLLKLTHRVQSVYKSDKISSALFHTHQFTELNKFHKRVEKQDENISVFFFNQAA
jgi:hypothetical protein